MRIQLNHIVEKLRQHSNKLDNYAILTEQPWIIKTDNENDRCVFIFRNKENELIISLNGKVEKGKWDYIPSMNSLIVETKTGTTLYNQGFVDDSIMILKVDGTDNYQLFANENRIDSTIEKLLEQTERRYLNNYPLKKQPEKDYINNTSENQVVIRKLKDGRNFEIHSSLSVGYTIGDKVTIDGKFPIDGEYKFGWFDSLLVEEGKIKRL